MAIEIILPTNQHLMEIDRDLIAVTEDSDPVFNAIMPTENDDCDLLEWEQEDNLVGRQQARGMNGQPSPVAWLGGQRFRAEPGYLGEFKHIDEEMMTKLRPFGQLTGVVDLTELVGKSQQHLAQREFDQIRYMGWLLLTTGQVVVPKRGGGYEYRDSYPIPNLTMSPGASAFPSTASVITFLRTVQLQGRGTSSKFDRGSTIYVNLVTTNTILNTAELSTKFRIGGGNTANKLGDFNDILSANNLPQLATYDEGFLSDGTDGNALGAFIPFIPNGVGVAIARRTNNAPVAKYRKTRNANNGDFGPGTYNLVVDSLTTGNPVPRTVTVHRGHNGGPVILYPSGVKILQFG